MSQYGTSRRNGQLDFMWRFRRSSEAGGRGGLARPDANDPIRTLSLIKGRGRFSAISHSRPTAAKCYAWALDGASNEASQVHHTAGRRGSGLVVHRIGAAAGKAAPDSDFSSGNPDQPPYRNGWRERIGVRFSASYAAWDTSKEKI